MLKRRLSNSFHAKRARITRLPQIFNRLVEAKLKRDAAGIIEMFQEGIRDNSFRLERLKPATIARKAAQGYRKPRAPLYGKGDDHRDSLINMWYFVKIKNGWRVRPRNAQHHSRRIKLKDLWIVHEEGRTIQTARGVINIPARPAWERAQQRYLKARLREENAEEVRKAIREVMRTGRAYPVRKFINRMNRESAEHERTG